MTQDQIIKLSEEIKLQRFKTKKTQEDCAKYLDISTPTFREYENNPNKMDLDQLIKLGDFLKFDMAKFFLNSILQNAK